MTTNTTKPKDVLAELRQQEQALTVPLKSLKPKRRLTMEATSLARMGQMLFRAEGELEIIQMPARTKGGDPQQAVALPVCDLETNEVVLLICNALLVSALRRAGEPLAGRMFAAKAGEIKAGKSYRTIDVMEVELQK